MDRDILNSNALQALLAFAILLAVFYLWFNHWRPMRERGAKLIDYWWLSFAALGILTAAGEARRVFAPFQIEMTRPWTLNSLNLLRDVATAEYHCQQFISTDNNQSFVEEAQRREDAECEWAKSVAEQLPLDGDLDALLRKRPVLPQIPTLVLPEIDEVKDIVEAHGYLLSSLDQYERAVEMAEVSDVEMTIIALSPFLLSIALALRFAKVGVELRLNREKELREREESAAAWRQQRGQRRWRKVTGLKRNNRAGEGLGLFND